MHRSIRAGSTKGKMKITKHRTAPYQYKTIWQDWNHGELTEVHTYGFVFKNIVQPNCEKAMLLLMKMKELKNGK